MHVFTKLSIENFKKLARDLDQRKTFSFAKLFIQLFNLLTI